MGFFDLFKKKKNVDTPKIYDEPQKLSDEQAEKILEMVREMSKKTAYRLTIDESRQPALCDSKFGGVPYWDLKLEYPVSSKGEKLIFLAQINLSDVANCELLPSSGILQFFIGANDLYGMDFNSYISNDTFRVVYHETVDETISAEDVMALGISTCTKPSDDYDEFLFPLNCEIAVNVEKTEISVGSEDFMFDKYFYKAAEAIGLKLPENESAFCLLPEDAFDTISNNNIGHWLFGYAYFTQNDPREYMLDLQDYVLLFQMDSDYAQGKKYEILWGDAGVGNFFIKLDDLKNLDFSKVMYTWDCC